MTAGVMRSAGSGRKRRRQSGPDIERAVEINLRMWVDGPQRQPADVDPGVREQVRQMLELNLPRQGEDEARDLEPLAINRLGEIQAPTLVIVGSWDMPEIIDSSRMLAQEIRAARIEQMAGVVHLPNMEQPDEFNRLVLEFVASV